MYVPVRQRFLLLFLTIFALTIPAMADDVTISGNVNFSSLDGSSLDHDGAVNGVFTVDDGNLTILGTVNCNDDGVSSNSACNMSFAVSGNLLLQSGSAVYAENRNGGGTGGNITFNVGGNVVVAGPSGAQAGAIVSSGNTVSSNVNAGAITFNADGTALFSAGSVISAAAKGGKAGAITVDAGGQIDVRGLIASGPSSTVSTATRYDGVVLSGGSSPATGGDITIRSSSHTEPAITVSSDAIIVSQGGKGGSRVVVLEGCGININGLVATVSQEGANARVIVRSGTGITLDARDLATAGGTRRGMVRADALLQDAGSYSANFYGREAISILGPASGSLYAVTSNGGTTSKDAAGTITVISTGGTASASGNAFEATGVNPGDQGGHLDIAAKGDVNLNTAKAILAGDFASGQNLAAGGNIAVRSYSGSISWQNGTGDVRPVGSAATVPVAQQGTITLTYCTTISTTGSSFPTNGAAVGAFPATAQSCSPAAPSLPAGETHPDCNDAPIVTDDAYVVAEGGTLSVPAPGVLGNDVDPDGDPFTAVLVSGPAHATSFTLNADGSFSYTHDSSETTTDTFTYQATDGMATSTVATVTITITPVNDAPVANDDNYSVNEGGTINYAAPGVLANDTDSDGPAMAAVLVSGPAHASSFVLNADGSFIYVHDGSETTTDSFTYKANDGSLDSNVATASIAIAPVNDAPVAVNDNGGTVAEGGTLNGASVLTNDTDAENDSLTAVLVSGPANASSFVLNADGTFTYLHNGGETTSDSFTYKANDGSLDSNVATVTITINAVNDAPVAVADDGGTVAEGGTLNGTSVLANDTDAENDSLTAVLVSGPANASSFVLNADGTFTYVHDGSETTSDSFTYKANDGSLDSNTVTVTITITAVNDAPVAVADNGGTVAEGGTLNGTSVLANDTDAENDSLTAVLVSGPANASSFTLNADGTFTYVHDGGETTTDTFTYKANDGALDSNTVTVTITITAVNDAPVAVADSRGPVAEGGTLNGSSVLANDTDAENDSLTAVLVSGPANASSFTLNADGTFTYVHDGSETTTDSFTYKANDGALDSNTVTVTITITAVNDAPVAVADNGGAVAEGGTLNGSSVLANDTDAENDTLTAVLVSGPSNAASFVLNADGTFTYVHNGSETTSDSFTYKANDGSADSNTVTVTIAITPVNDAPVAVADGPYTVTAGQTLTVPAPGVLGNDTDVDSPSLTAVLVTGPANATSFALNADGSFTYSSNTIGSDWFSYYATDGTAQSNIVTVSINVISLPPVALDDVFNTVGNTELRVGLGSSLTPHVAISGSVLDNDTDADTPHASLTVVAFDATSANGGTVTMTPSGNFTYVPPAGSNAPDTFNYTVSDGLNTDSGTVTITFTGRVWYVNNTAVVGDGRSTTPFGSLVAAQAASVANDYIYVDFGNGTNLNYSSTIILQDGQRLIGEGVALVVGPYTLAPAGPRPTIGSVVLGNGNTAAGFNTTGGITGSSVNSGTITSVDVTGGSTGIALTSVSGTFTLNTVNSTPAAGTTGLSVTGTAAINATGLNVTTSGATGIVGSGSGTFSIAGGTVSTTNGTAVNLSNHNLAIGLTAVNATSGVNGINLSNTTGTFAVNGTGATGSGGTITGMSGLGVNATDATGVTLKYMNINASGVHGVLMTNTLGASSTLDVANSSFSGNFGNAIQASSNAGALNVTVDGNTFANNNAAVLAQVVGTGGAIVKITNNASTFNSAAPYTVTRNSPGSGAVEATITNNTVGAAGVPGSGCASFCGGIQVLGLGSNTFKALVSNNTVRQVAGTAILVRAGEGSSALSATISDNLIEQPVGTPSTGILVQSGTLGTDTTAVCAHIVNNTVTGWTTHIFVRNVSAGSTFSVPGYAGLGTDTTAVANFIKAQNTVTTVTALRKTTVPANQFSGGPLCATPAP
ncbi:MAG TPA: Ig-like domain-containing protein [Thermoanaerobaculia bacterium]|nr:Ig-like domain-containing protein [Thermoanaerobaculia bacterium]